MEDLESLELDEFDASEYLTSDEAIAAYLTEALECGDAGLVAQALGNVARARGMADIAQKTGLAREGLYKALRANSQPRLDTISKVLNAFNLRLVAEVIPADQRATKCEDQGAQPKVLAAKKKVAQAKQAAIATKQ
ncbi:putative addiction module antidote protein [Oxalobacteraceae bacterium]|nr:putative addiction module antidote protein [Oxalobacteraceae bacterium]